MLFLGPTQAQVASDTELFHDLSSDTMLNLGLLDSIDIFLNLTSSISNNQEH